MYKRTEKALLDNPPVLNSKNILFDAQMGQVKYYDKYSPTITARYTNSAYGLIQIKKKTK